MELVEFSEQTVIIAKDQPEYRPLPAHRHRDDRQGRITCCWQLTWRERLQVLLTGRLWHSILTFNQELQPQLLSVDKPAMEAPPRADSYLARIAVSPPLVRIVGGDRKV